jgi:hypothetical protein
MERRLSAAGQEGEREETHVINLSPMLLEFCKISLEGFVKFLSQMHILK